MEKNCKLNMTPEEIIALASSLAMAIGNNFDSGDIASLKTFFSAVASNLSLFEAQNKNRHRTEKK